MQGIENENQLERSILGPKNLDRGMKMRVHQNERSCKILNEI
jgi:hypothetical protein